MWRKSKIFLLNLCLLLILLTIFSHSAKVRAENKNEDGFIIEADRVDGSGMTASIFKQETSNSDGKPMLRIHYQTAVIYGMRLTKEMDTPDGPVSITLKANGPVRVKGMTVDTTAISFKGACINASETVPEVAMENVVMVAHFMKSEDSLINQLVLRTVAGSAGTNKPGKLKLLEDLSLLPINQLDKEVEKISKGKLPLTCEDGTRESLNPSNGSGKVTDTLQKVVDVVPNPLKPVTDSLDPVLKPLNPVVEPIKPVVKALEPITKPLEPVLESLEPATKPLEPVVTATTEKVSQALQSACVRIKEAKGVITKEWALNLIDEAREKKVPLSKTCLTDSSLTVELQKWEESLLKSLGVIDLLGKIITQDPVQQLNKIRDHITKEKDGAIIYSP